MVVAQKQGEGASATSLKLQWQDQIDHLEDEIIEELHEVSED